MEDRSSDSLCGSRPVSGFQSILLHGVAREIVFGRPETTGQNDDLGACHGSQDRIGQARAFVTDPETTHGVVMGFTTWDVPGDPRPDWTENPEVLPARLFSASDAPASGT